MSLIKSDCGANDATWQSAPRERTFVRNHDSQIVQPSTDDDRRRIDLDNATGQYYFPMCHRGAANQDVCSLRPNEKRQK